MSLLSAVARKRVAGGGGSPIYTSPVPDILHYRFAEGGGTTLVADVGPNGTTNASRSAGPSGIAALSLDGATTYGRTNSAIVYPTPIFAASFWLKLNSAPANDIVVESHDAPGTIDNTAIVYAGPTLLVGYIFSGAGAYQRGLANPPLDTWEHFTYIVDGTFPSGDVVCYRNGVFEANSFVESAKDNNGNLATGFINIGSRDSGDNSFLDGHIADLRVYSYVLNATEALEIYNNPL